MLSTFSGERLAVGTSCGDARRQAFEQARARWCGVEITFEDFAAHLDRLGWSSRLPPQFEAVYLCAACSLGSAAACSALEREYFAALRSALARRHRRWDFVDEVLQQTRERLMVGPMPRIASYRGDGSLPSWLRRVAHRIAVDVCRVDGSTPAQFVEWQRYQARAAVEASLTPGSGTPVAAHWTRWLEHTLVGALTSLDAPDRCLLRMFYVQGVKIEEIGRCYGIDRSTAYRRLHRAERVVRRRVVDAIREKTGLSAADDLRDLLHSTCDQLSVGASVWGGEAGAREPSAA